MIHGVTVAINQCPDHREYWSVSVDKAHTGTRITPSKCCGRWHVVREWKMTPTQLREAARAFADAAEDLENELDGVVPSAGETPQ